MRLGQFSRWEEGTMYHDGGGGQLVSEWKRTNLNSVIDTIELTLNVHY